MSKARGIHFNAGKQSLLPNQGVGGRSCSSKCGLKVLLNTTHMHVTSSRAGAVLQLYLKC